MNDDLKFEAKIIKWLVIWMLVMSVIAFLIARFYQV